MKRNKAARTTKILASMGATETINSGATFADNDAILKTDFPIGNFRYNGISIEVKATNKKSFSVSKELWEKIKKEAAAGYHLPTLVIDLLDGDKTLVVLDKEDFIDIIERLMKNEHTISKS